MSAGAGQAQAPITHLNEHMFRNLPTARRLIEEWRMDYNAHRPHTSLGGLSPNEFATRSRTDLIKNRVQL
jgi:putative transposase